MIISEESEMHHNGFAMNGDSENAPKDAPRPGTSRPKVEETDRSDPAQAAPESENNTRFLLILGVISALVYAIILFGLRERGTSLGGGLQVIIGLWLGIPALLSALFHSIRAQLNGSIRDAREASRAFAFAIACAGLAGTVPLANHLMERDIAEAKDYCQRLVEEGVIRKDTDGLYPASIDSITLPGRPPRLLRKTSWYTAAPDRQGFTMSFRYDFDTELTYIASTGGWLKST